MFYKSLQKYETNSIPMINYERNDANIFYVDDFFKVGEIILETNITLEPEFNSILEERDQHFKQHYDYLDHYEKRNTENIKEFEIVVNEDELSGTVEGASFSIFLTDRIIDQSIDGNHFKILDGENYKWLPVSEFDEKLEKHIGKFLRARGFSRYETDKKYSTVTDNNKFNTLDDLINYYDAQESRKDLLKLLEDL